MFSKKVNTIPKSPEPNLFNKIVYNYFCGYLMFNLLFLIALP